jgi:hypothetical protein
MTLQHGVNIPSAEIQRPHVKGGDPVVREIERDHAAEHVGLEESGTGCAVDVDRR